MGTNFYLMAPRCSHCNQQPERKHIGKSSAGWCFSLHVYPDEGINTLDDWKPLLLDASKTIEDEYGNMVSPDDMLKWITERGPRDNSRDTHLFHQENGSEPGPRGMIRCRLSRHCVGHGEGTYDYHVGDFS